MFNAFLVLPVLCKTDALRPKVVQILSSGDGNDWQQPPIIKPTGTALAL